MLRDRTGNGNKMWMQVIAASPFNKMQWGGHFWPNIQITLGLVGQGKIQGQSQGYGQCKGQGTLDSLAYRWHAKRLAKNANRPMADQDSQGTTYNQSSTVTLASS